MFIPSDHRGNGVRVQVIGYKGGDIMMVFVTIEYRIEYNVKVGTKMYLRKNSHSIESQI